MHKPNIGYFGWICVLQMVAMPFSLSHENVRCFAPFPQSSLEISTRDSFIIGLFYFALFASSFDLFICSDMYLIYLVLLRWALHIVHDKLPNSNVELLIEGIVALLQILDLFIIEFYFQRKKRKFVFQC